MHKEPKGSTWSQRKKRLSVSELAATRRLGTGKSWKLFNKRNRKTRDIYIFIYFAWHFDGQKKRTLRLFGSKAWHLSAGGFAEIFQICRVAVFLVSLLVLLQRWGSRTYLGWARSHLCNIFVQNATAPNVLQTVWSILNSLDPTSRCFIMFHPFGSVKPQPVAVVSWLPPLPLPSVAVWLFDS